MSDSKKDLTRIEDLAEYLHELNDENESFEPPADLPEVPSEDDVPDFGSSFESEGETDFSSTEEEPAFGTTEESTFTSEEEPAFGSGDESPFTTDEESPFDGGDESPFTTEDTSAFGGEEVSTFTTEDSPAFGESEEATFTSEEGATFGDSEGSAFTTEEEPDFGASETETTADFESSSHESGAVSDENSFAPEDTKTTFEPEPEPEPEHIQPIVEDKSYKAPENFADLKKFAESSSFAGMGAEGNPSFSVLLKNVRYIEDVNDILSMLKELGLMSDPEDQIKARLMRGHLLVPRISEYAAIFLAHKLRRFDIDIQVGLSDEIHPPKHQEAPETGLVSKHTLYQNQTHHFHFDDPKLEISHIIVAATPNLEGHQVIRYLGVASEHKMLDGQIVEDEGSDEIPRHYSELALKLKAHALKAHANAVIGLNYQLTPLPSEYGLNSNKYRLSCTGNLVWVNKL